MRVERIICDEETEFHLWSRHRLTPREVEEAAYRHGLAVRGREPDIYEVFGKTEVGRYLMVAVRYAGRGAAKLITARDMTQTERRRYRRHVAH